MGPNKPQFNNTACIW